MSPLSSHHHSEPRHSTDGVERRALATEWATQGNATRAGVPLGYAPMRMHEPVIDAAGWCGSCGRLVSAGGQCGCST